MLSRARRRTVRPSDGRLTVREAFRAPRPLETIFRGIGAERRVLPSEAFAIARVSKLVRK